MTTTARFENSNAAFWTGMGGLGISVDGLVFDLFSFCDENGFSDEERTILLNINEQTSLFYILTMMHNEQTPFPTAIDPFWFSRFPIRLSKSPSARALNVWAK